MENQVFDATTLRLQLRELTGRRDLIDADGFSTGIDFYIDCALRWLDQQLPTDSRLGRWVYQASSGEYKLPVPRCRAVKGVWMYDETGECRGELIKRSISWLRSKYTEDWADLSTGQPLYYTPNVDNLAPTQWNTASFGSSYSDTSDLNFGTDPDAFRRRNLLVLPPTDGTYTFNVVGAFFTNSITDQPLSFWTVMYPDAVILATQMKMEEMCYRNSEGAKGFLAALAPILSGIDYDAVEEEMAAIHRVDRVREDLRSS